MGDAPRPGSGSDKPEAESAELERRRRALKAELEGAVQRHEPPPESGDRARALGMAFRIATELLAGLLVGGVLGWFLDAWLGTRPFLFLLFLALGAVAGMRNVFRYAYRMNRLAEGVKNDAGPGADGTNGKP